jgi:hypothetical protein
VERWVSEKSYLVPVRVFIAEYNDKKRPHQGVFVFYKLGQFYLSDEAFSEDDFSDEALSLLLFSLSFSAGFDSFSPDLPLPEERLAPEGERWSVA